MKANLFLKTYEECLREEIVRTPQNFTYGLDKVPVVVERAAKAFETSGINGFALSGQAIRLAFKRLGVPKVTYKSFNEWLKTE